MTASAETWNDLYARLGAATLPYGPPLADGTQIELAEGFDHFAVEYAALRQRVGVMHLPQRAVLSLTGADVKDYLHRLCTQQINALPGGQSVRAFQLDEKGRIAADMIVHHGDASTWLEMDAFDLPWVAELIEARLFAEDVTVEDWSGRRTLLWLLGPAAVRLLTAVTGNADAARVGELAQLPGTHHVLNLPLNGGSTAATTVYRWDLGRVLGLRLAVPSEHALEVYGGLLAAAGYEPGAEPDAEHAQRRRESMRGRPIGWSAFNTVRIEEGVPWYHVDFGRDSLPAEVPGPAGIDGAVSFTKGCYLGQEVVARMKSLGHPKKLLVGLAFDGDGSHDAGQAPPPGDQHAVPAAGAQVLDVDDKQKVIGGLTSSTAAPLRSQSPIGLAVMRWGKHRPGTAVQAAAGGRLIRGRVVGLDELSG